VNKPPNPPPSHKERTSRFLNLVAQAQASCQIQKQQYEVPGEQRNYPASQASRAKTSDGQTSELAKLCRN